MGLPVMENFYSLTKSGLHYLFCRCLPENLCKEFFFFPIEFCLVSLREAGYSERII